MEREVLLLACVAYFKSHQGFDNVFKKMKEKYKSLGKMGGTIVITYLSEAEKEALTGFLRKDYSRQKSASISLEKFQKALAYTRFDGLCLEDILKKYFEEEITSNKDERERFLEKRKQFFQGCIQFFKGTIAGKWLEDVMEKQYNAYPFLMKKYNNNKKQLRQHIEDVANAFNHLPCFFQDAKGIAVFASQITKNPHAFDAGTDCGMLLQYAIMYELGENKPQNAEEKAEIYYRVGILVDEISNYTICCGLRAITAGKRHAGWQGFYEASESMQVSLKNLSTVESIMSPVGKVFVVENPAVFSSILDKLSGKPVPLVCTYGQVKLASLILLDKLAVAGTDIYYSGDFDPEGLMIADKLKTRYKERLILWRYTIADYQAVISREKITPNRIKKLNHLKDKQLKKIAEALTKEGYAGYQELLVDALVQSIQLNKPWRRDIESLRK